MVLSQLFGGPAGPEFFPPAICAIIIRLGNRPSCCRIVASAKESRRFRMVVLMLSHFILLRALSVREVCMVQTTLEAKDLLEDFEVRLSELVTMSHVTMTMTLPRSSAKG